MEHPFFKNISTFLYYAAVWILITGIHIFILISITGVETVPATVDGIVFNFLFALLAIPVWYIIKFSKIGKSNILNIFINHITTATGLLLIWIAAGLGLLHFIFSKDTGYLEYLSSSISMRIIIGIFFYSIIVLIYYIFVYYGNLQERLTSEKKLMEMIKQAELDLLKSQINPHFLFNSLNSISSLTITDPAKAQEMIIMLSDFLRYSVSQPLSHITTLEKEFENIRRYLDIEQIRFGSKLIYSNEITDNCLRAEIPAMILQPLYENAVKHGVYESTEQIRINTKCNMNYNVLEIMITNNFDPSAVKRKGTGIGLKNIRDRLKLIYKNELLLKTNIKDNLFEVKLFIPQSTLDN